MPILIPLLPYKILTFLIVELYFRQLNQCRYAQDEMSDLLEAYKREVAVYNVHIKSFHSQQIENSWEQKVMELEQGLLNAERIKGITFMQFNQMYNYFNLSFICIL